MKNDKPKQSAVSEMASPKVNMHKRLAMGENLDGMSLQSKGSKAPASKSKPTPA